jgi:hypothetical protein
VRPYATESKEDAREKDEALCSISGMVASSNGEFIADALVILSGMPILSEKPSRSVTVAGSGSTARTNEWGRYSFSDIQPGTVELRAIKNGFADQVVKRKLTPGMVNVDFTLKEVAGESIGGKVIDVKGEPIAGAKVTAYWKEPNLWPDESSSTQTSEAGEFTVKGLPEDKPCKVAAKTTGLREKSVEGVSPGSTGIVIQLDEQTGSVSGEVKFSGEAPARYEVAIYPEGARQSCQKRLLKYEEEKGKFAFQDLDAGNYRLVANAEGYGTAVVENVLVEAGRETAGVEIYLGACGTIVGRVTLEGSNTPVSQAMVRATYELSGRTMSRLALTDKEGKFKITGLAPAEYTLWCSKDLLSSKDNAKKVFVASGAEVECNLELPAGAVLSGKVTANEGVDVTKLVVSVQSKKAGLLHSEVGKDGSYRIANMKPGECIVSLENPKTLETIRSRKVTLTAGKETQVDFSLVGAITFRGKVFLNNEPWANTFFMMRKGDDEMFVATDKNGSFERKDTLPGKYTCYFAVKPEEEPLELKQEIEMPDQPEFCHEFNVSK